MIQCTKCKGFLPGCAFHKRSDNPGKLRSHCRDCINKENRNNYYKSDRFHKNKVAYKYNLKVNYGLSEEAYNNLFTKQNGSCCICSEKLCNRFLNEDGKVSVVDHDHSTGIVRGILCGDCNRGLGAFKDNVEFINKASDYIETHSNRH